MQHGMAGSAGSSERAPWTASFWMKMALLRAGHTGQKPETPSGGIDWFSLPQKTTRVGWSSLPPKCTRGWLPKHKGVLPKLGWFSLSLSWFSLTNPPLIYYARGGARGEGVDATHTCGGCRQASVRSKRPYGHTRSDCRETSSSAARGLETRRGKRNELIN